MAFQFSLDTAGTLLTSLVEWWKMEEASGTRLGYFGGNDLTDNATVTQAAGKVGSAAQFTAANSEFLSRLDNAALSTGDIDFTFAGWVYLDADAQMTILSKLNGGAGDTEYFLYYEPGATDRFRWAVYDGTNSIGTVDANTFGAAALSTWYFVECWHDVTNNQVGIRINNGGADVAATSGAAGDGTGTFRMGAYHATPQVFWDGRIDEVGFWKKLLSSQERSDLYNGGSGNTLNAVSSLPARVMGRLVSGKNLACSVAAIVEGSKSIPARVVGLVAGNSPIISRVVGLRESSKSLVCQVTGLVEVGKSLVARVTGRVKSSKNLVCRVDPLYEWAYSSPSSSSWEEESHISYIAYEG